MRRQVVDSFDALQALRPAWDALHARDLNATPFQHSAWLLPWWKHVGQGELLTFAAHENERLVALAPFYVYSGSGKRQLFPVGIGTTDYLDALCEPGFESALETLFELLAEYRDRFDEVVWPRLRPSSPLLTIRAPENWRSEVVSDEPCPVFNLPRTEVELQRRLPARLRRELRFAWRQASHDAQTMRSEAATNENWREAWLHLLRVHALRWEFKGESGVLSDPCVRAMHEEALPLLLRAGLLRFYVLRLDDEVIGALYNLCDAPSRTDARIYSYISGFDPDFAKFGPGSVLIGNAMREAVRDGYSAFDFLTGQEPYKYVWGAHDTNVFKRKLILDG